MIWEGGRRHWMQHGSSRASGKHCCRYARQEACRSVKIVEQSPVVRGVQDRRVRPRQCRAHLNQVDEDRSAFDLRRRHARTTAPVPTYSVDPEGLDVPEMAQPDDPFDVGSAAGGVVAASAGLIPAEVPPCGTPTEASSSASGPLASIKIWQVHCG